MFNLTKYLASLQEANSHAEVTEAGDKKMIVEPQAAMDRRRMLQGAGAFLGGAGMLAAAMAAPASAEPQPNAEPVIDGLWQSVVSGGGATFSAIEIYGGNLWIGSGQTDLLPVAFASSLWAVFNRIGHLQYRGVGRFWVYNWTPPSGPAPNGFIQVDQITTLSRDGKTYQGLGQFTVYDNNGNIIPGAGFTGTDNGVRIA